VPLLATPIIDFGFRLLGQLESASVISPVSVHTALATVREGASGEAREALDAVLGPEPPAALDVRDPGVELALAQALWIDRRYRLTAGFTRQANALGVDCRTLDFADPRAPDEVNAWAASMTRGMIPEVIDSFSPDEVFALANAAYFDGKWTMPFDPEATDSRPFTRPDGGARPVAMMHAHGEFVYGEDEHVEAIWLPYGDTRDLGFVAVIARDGLEAPRLDAPGWSALRETMTSREGSVALPRLQTESRLELTDALQSLGLGPAFESGFEEMIEGPGEKALSRVLQRARVDLDETGTRAAAVTVVTARAVSLRLDEPPPFDLRLDRPFLWAIEHRPSGTPLFMGIVTDPEESS
jgi:serine protease inhibitor